MCWQSIGSQADLDALNRRVCWEDSESVEYYATPRNEPYFPSDISRSGYLHKNLHVLCRVCSQEAAFLEMVWIHCDSIAGHFLDHPHLSGRVDSLKRVEVMDAEKSTQMRCSRLIYGFLPEGRVMEGSFYAQHETKSEN
jgi:hypothetical protein